MWMSLEILVIGYDNESISEFTDFDITVVSSNPPQSHRGSSSLWQSIFQEKNGTLFHLGDPIGIKVREDRYYLYDVFDKKKSGVLFSKFLPDYEASFEKIISILYLKSAGNGIIVSTDVWLGPSKFVYKSSIPVDKFILSVKNNGIRRNSLRYIY